MTQLCGDPSCESASCSSEAYEAWVQRQKDATREAFAAPARPTAGDLLGSVRMDETVDECMDRIRGRGRAMFADLSAAQDEIERRITECEGHRALIDAVLAEREHEKLYYEVLVLHLADQAPQGLRTGEHPLTVAALALAAAREHRQAVVDSIGGA